MATEIKTEILINAAPEKIWAILTDFDNYPNWNPFIKTIEGRVEIGSKPCTTGRKRKYPQSFNKLFKKKTRVSPLEFRQSFN